jgi:predicted ChrR family anti-sigma factor
MRQRLTCREAIALLTDYQERALPWNQRLFTRMHLWRCPECREFFEAFGSIPGLVARCEDLDEARFVPLGEAALANVLQRLQEPRPHSGMSRAPIPQPVQRLLEGMADLPLRLMAQTHAAMLQGVAPRTEPYLPDAVLAQLPPARSWKWSHFPGGIRRARLNRDMAGPSLSLVFMPPDYTLARHTHLGSESLLVLDGELEHEDRCLTDGDWIHLETGTHHAPQAYGRGCWCLVRDEGSLSFEGPFGWLKGMLAGA